MRVRVENVDVLGRTKLLKTLGKEPSDTLASSLGMEHHHPILSMMSSNGRRIEREREIFFISDRNIEIIFLHACDCH